MGLIQVEGRGESGRGCHPWPSVNECADDQADDDYVSRSLDWLVVPEDKRDRLECSTRPLDYLDRQ
jgi:hypothetical protein